MRWSSGMASSLARRALCPSQSLNLVCKILISLFGLSETNTIGYEMHIKGSWRFDMFLLCPLYLVILGSWFVRLLIVVKAHAWQKSSDAT